MTFASCVKIPRYQEESTYTMQLIMDCDVAVTAARREGKVVAVAETGISNGIQSIKDPDWYMKSLLRPLMDHASCKRLTYMLTWSNINPDYYWVPLDTDVRNPFRG